MQDLTSISTVNFYDYVFCLTCQIKFTVQSSICGGVCVCNFRQISDLPGPFNSVGSVYQSSK